MSFRDDAIIGGTAWTLCTYSAAGRWSLNAGDMHACRIMFDRWRRRILFRRRTRLLVFASSTADFTMTYGNAVPASITKIVPSTVSILSTYYTPWEFVSRNPCLPVERFGGVTGGVVQAVAIDTIPASQVGIVVSANSAAVQLLIVRL